MKTIHVSDECARAIRAAAFGNSFKQTGVQRPDGTWDIPVSDDTHERILAHCLPGETESDCIVRILGTSRGLN